MNLSLGDDTPPYTEPTVRSQLYIVDYSLVLLDVGCY